MGKNVFFFAVFKSPAMHAAPCPYPFPASLPRRQNHRLDPFNAESALGRSQSHPMGLKIQQCYYCK